MHSIAMNCACMSVAKPGKGAVDNASGFRPPSALTLMPRLWNSIISPAWASAFSVACMSSGRAPMRSIDPPVIPAAQA